MVGGGSTVPVGVAVGVLVGISVGVGVTVDVGVGWQGVVLVGSSCGS